MTTFFVPNSRDGKDEELYATLAKMAGRAPQPPGERIESISWTHDGEEWVATVGQQLRGTKIQMRTRQKKRVSVTERLSDPATVLAIFPGTPYLVVTNKGLDAVRSYWENPFMAGQPNSVRFFDTGDSLDLG
jgi:hypothetical protein